MDSNSLERVSQAVGTWLSRRQVIKGVAVLLAGKSSSGQVAAQDLAGEVPTIEPEPVYPTEPDPPPPTEPPWPTETPTQVPTNTPTHAATETPTHAATETPTHAATETPTPTETATAQPQQPQVLDDTRRRIAEICQAAADVLAEDVAEPQAFENHPHPESAYGFLNTLNGIALWGTQAETWDDKMLANYVVCGDNIAYAVRIGADAYYEVLRQQVAGGQILANDPDTCIFEELASWRDCIETCAPDDAVCRLTCFWNFTVLNSCRRCLRGF